MRDSEHELVDDQRRLAAAALRRLADRADDVAEMDVDLAGARGRAEELDPAAAVDEVEEDELAHVAPREHASGEPPRLVALGPASSASASARTAAISSRSGNLFGSDVLTVVLTIAQAFGPSSGVSTLGGRRANPCDS